jgi:hypothetical protein
MHPAFFRTLALAAALPLGACGSANLPPKEAPAQAGRPVATVKSEPTVTAPATVGPQVRLLDPGSEPRQRLRYRLAAGPAQSMQADIEMSMAMSVAGQEMPKVPMPVLRFVSRITPEQLTPEGDLRASYEVTKIDLPAGDGTPAHLRAAMMDGMKALVGIKGSAPVTSRGVTKEADLEAPQDAPPNIEEIVENLRRSLRDMCAPFPEEPVGKGAEWEITKEIKGKIHVQQRARYVLTALGASDARLEVAITQTAPPQPLPGKRSKVKTELTSFESNGKASVHVSFDSLVPESRVSLNTDMRADITDDGKTAPMRLDLALEMLVKPVAGAP